MYLFYNDAGRCNTYKLRLTHLFSGEKWKRIQRLGLSRSLSSDMFLERLNVVIKRGGLGVPVSARLTFSKS